VPVSLVAALPGLVDSQIPKCPLFYNEKSFWDRQQSEAESPSLHLNSIGDPT
jgi:hypothetical protein